MRLQDTVTNLIAVLTLIVFGLWIALFLKNPTIDALNVMTQLLLLAIALKGLSTWREQFKHKLQWERRHMELKELRRTKTLLDKLANDLAIYYGNVGMSKCENYEKKLIPYIDNIIENVKKLQTVLSEQGMLKNCEPTQAELQNLFKCAKYERIRLLNPSVKPGSVLRNATHSDDGLKASSNMTLLQVEFTTLLMKYGNDKVSWNIFHKIEEQIKAIQSTISSLEN